MTYQPSVRQMNSRRSADELLRRYEQGAAARRQSAQRPAQQRTAQTRQRPAQTRYAGQQVRRPASSAYGREAYYEAVRRKQIEEQIRREEMRRAAEEERRRRRLEYLKACEKKLKAEKAAQLKKERAAARAEEKRVEREKLAKEVKVAKNRISFSFVMILLIATCMLMAVIFSFAQVSRSTGELSDAKSRLEALKAEEKELNFALEQKNDIRLVEQIATERIGMVKEGSVEKRFISMSAGDYIELEDTGSAKTEKRSNPLGTVLSSFSSVFDNIMDYVG